ncbi:VOC family protein [Paenibacillus sp. PSB04]|uniref:VOC family protein n=1 Tax=Paenibacillus sp. PSB04 TaxID=2866810 RepID=UPI0021F162AF|nr:VOC family protein [Paenibacillus sp. PSB04]UYO02325.1 VOC family protein [Paenibacillus sp. PSB04]
MASYLNQIRFNDIPVSDLEYSLEWYQSVLGFDVQYKNDDIGILRLERGPGLILTRSDNRSSHGKISTEGKAVPMIGLETHQIDRLYRFLCEKGVPVTPIRNEDIGRFFGFIDPDGHRYSVLRVNH